MNMTHNVLSYIYRSDPSLTKGKNCMYLTIKQQVKNLSKDDYCSIKELCHTAKKLTNEAIYNVRQYYFAEGKFLKYEKNYSLLKNSSSYKALKHSISISINFILGRCGHAQEHGIKIIKNCLILLIYRTMYLVSVLSIGTIKFLKKFFSAPHKFSNWLNISVFEVTNRGLIAFL